MNKPVQYLDALAIDQAVVDALTCLPFSETGTRRVCLHKTEAAPLHVMLVESLASQRFPAHRHSDSDELSTVVSGVLEVMIWDQGESIAPRVVRIGNQPGLAKATFVPRGVAHVTRAVDQNCTYIEVKLGPFDKSAMVMSDESTLARSA